MRRLMFIKPRGACKHVGHAVKMSCFTFTIKSQPPPQTIVLLVKKTPERWLSKIRGKKSYISYLCYSFQFVNLTHAKYLISNVVSLLRHMHDC